LPPNRIIKRIPKPKDVDAYIAAVEDLMLLPASQAEEWK
jgi:hypothetical protein